MNGVITIYKEKGYTSFHVVYIIRRITKEQKVGHTGTLDPDVTGVLPICLGKATKLVGQLTDTDKTYRCRMLLGRSTDTQDASGNVLQEMDEEHLVRSITQQAGENAGPDDVIRAAILAFTGDIEQIPPMYSALKVDGVKLVNAARRGVQIDRKPRKVTVYSIEDISVDPDLLHAEFTICCSKGTYVRTLCEDIGRRLGVPACMESLERTRAAGLGLSDAITLEQAQAFAEEGTLAEHIRSTDSFLTEYAPLIVCDEAVRKLIFGNILYSSYLKTPEGTAAQADPGQIFRIYDRAGEFYALYRYDGAAGYFRCVKMFKDIE